MALTILNNISALTAENSLSSTQTNLQKTLTQLSSGLKINSGSDDAAGLSIANGMQANIAALTQSQQNASNGVGMLQTADGALSQVTTLLNRAVTLATEASSSNITSGTGSQADALNTEFQSILTEVNQIGSSTNFNGTSVFSSDPTTPLTNTVFISDGTSSGADNTTISTDVDALSATSLGLATTTGSGTSAVTTNMDLSSTADAQAALTAVNTAINTVSAQRGTIGASINRLQAATNVMSAQVQNLTSASNSIQDADIGKTVAAMTQYNILQSTGMAALQQANQAQQAVLKLVQ